MSMVATDIKDLFKISFKHRHDTYTDQYTRMFMIKLMLACTVVMGISWYTDKVNCILPSEHKAGDDFGKYAASACWINGLYIYRELAHRFNQSAYYGIPEDGKYDGLLTHKRTGQQSLCVSSTKSRFEKMIYAENGGCKPLQKTFFIQFQYMPFFIAALALLCYIPYMMHVTINHDLINLRTEVIKDEPDIDEIVKHYFKDSKKNKRRRVMVTTRQILNILIKVSYIGVHVVILLGLNSVLENQFMDYGQKWIRWANLDNYLQYDYMGNQSHPKPGNELLPPFGYCEVSSHAQMKTSTHNNYHKFICEISPHVLYQYAFLLIWFATVVGIGVSVLGLLILLFNYIIGLVGIKRLGNEGAGKRLLDTLTYREIEYLEYMRKRNMTVYGEVLEKLRERMLETPPPEFNNGYNNSDLPSYPMLGKQDQY